MASMKPLVAVAAFCGMAAGSAGCAFQFSVEGEYAESFEPDGAARVVLEGLDGDIVVRGLEIEDVEVHGSRRAVGATRREARERLGGVGLESRREGGDLVLSYAPDISDLDLVALTLDRASTLPTNMGLSAEVERGDIELTDVGGDVDVRTEAGDVDIEDVGTAAVIAATEEGGIEYAIAFDPDGLDLRIECDVGEDGVLKIDAALQSLLQRSDEGGIVVFTHAGTDTATAVKNVVLDAPGGEISLSLLSRSPKTWQ